MPIPSEIFDPQSAKAEVMPQGRPERASVAKLPIASATAPATSGQGPQAKRANPERGARLLHRRLDAWGGALPLVDRPPDPAQDLAREAVGAVDGARAPAGRTATP